MSVLRPVGKRKRVALAGFGVVGGGVYERLRREPDRYEVAGIICRDPSRLAEAGAPAGLFAPNVEALSAFDILVEAIGGLDPAGGIVVAALARGADVVTANKTLISRRFAAIEKAAAEAGAEVLYSAAVGGGVPMLETVGDVARRSGVVGLEAVINGTTNFVLDRLGAGASLAAAIAEAQQAGFAEADPSADIDGVDAAEKLSLLARRAFGANVDPARIAADRLASVAPRAIVDAARAGTPYKQVASARFVADRLQLSVRLRRVDAGDPLASARREENCLVIAAADGRTRVLHGKGAGRDPTAGSVLGDIERLFGRPGVDKNLARRSNAEHSVNASATPVPRY